MNGSVDFSVVRIVCMCMWVRISTLRYCTALCQVNRFIFIFIFILLVFIFPFAFVVHSISMNFCLWLESFCLSVHCITLHMHMSRQCATCTCIFMIVEKWNGPLNQFHFRHISQRIPFHHGIRCSLRIDYRLLCTDLLHCTKDGITFAWYLRKCGGKSDALPVGTHTK